MNRNHLETIPLTTKGVGLAKVQEEKFISFLNSIKGSSIIYRGVDGRYLKKNTIRMQTMCPCCLIFFFYMVTKEKHSVRNLNLIITQTILKGFALCRYCLN